MSRSIASKNASVSSSAFQGARRSGAAAWRTGSARGPSRTSAGAASAGRGRRAAGAATELPGPPQASSFLLEFSPLDALAGVATATIERRSRETEIRRVGLCKSRTLPGNVWSNVTPATSGKSLQKVEFAKVSVFSPPVGRFSASEWRGRVPGAEELSER
jgi:hypothetical protein